MNSQFKEVCEKMEAFDGVRVISINQHMNPSGNTSGKLEAIMYNECNLPKGLLDTAISVTQSMEAAPINIAGQYAVQEHVQGPVKYEVTFKYDRKFLFMLDRAHVNEIYKQHNKEVDEFIEKWLGTDDETL